MLDVIRLISVASPTTNTEVLKLVSSLNVCLSEDPFGNLLNLQKAQNQGIQSFQNTSKTLIARYLVFYIKSKEKLKLY